MNTAIQDNRWVWVVVQDPGENERFMGQHDPEKNESFIPAFIEKEAAEDGLTFLPRGRGHKYEVQAILLAELSHHAAENEFMLFILDGSGEVLEKIKPKGDI